MRNDGQPASQDDSAQIEKTEHKTGGKIIIASLTFALAALLFGGIYFAFAAKPTDGSKEISIHVIDDTASSTVYIVNTDAKYLHQAIDETKGLTVSGTESEYGLMVETVNGITADYEKDGAYWAFYVDGEYCIYGIDQQQVDDGQTYQIIYTID